VTVVGAADNVDPSVGSLLISTLCGGRAGQPYRCRDGQQQNNRQPAQRPERPDRERGPCIVMPRSRRRRRRSAIADQQSRDHDDADDGQDHAVEFDPSVIWELLAAADTWNRRSPPRPGWFLDGGWTRLQPCWSRAVTRGLDGQCRYRVFGFGSRRGGRFVPFHDGAVVVVWVTGNCSDSTAGTGPAEISNSANSPGPIRVADSAAQVTE